MGKKLLSLIGSLACCSCGVQYMADYRAEVARFDPQNTAAPEGPWRGEWKSEINGHTGPLWCVVSPVEQQPGHYDFRYRAGWGALRFGDYTHRVEGRHDGEAFEFSGEMDLPGGAGVHHVDGRITDEAFEARYRSERGDRGTMSLKRP